MDALCICASNMLGSTTKSTSYQICESITSTLDKKRLNYEIIDLRDYDLNPCIGCGKCYNAKRCIRDTSFNTIYEKMVQCKYIFFVSPHYAPIPAKLSMLLEKMEEITFLHWWTDETYQSEVYGIRTGILSHGGASDWALKSYKAMVNDTIANALETIQCKVIPYDLEWNTGISLPVSNVTARNSIFPVQEYDWEKIHRRITEYVEVVLNDEC